MSEELENWLSKAIDALEELGRDNVPDLMNETAQSGWQIGVAASIEELKSLASLRARPQEPGKCPTNHTCIDNYDENGDITTILWSDESIDYAFCPDCGAALREESK